MKIFKYICIVLFIVILILFTTAYNLKPIINVTASATAKILVPNGFNGELVSNNINANFAFLLYLDKLIDTSNENYITINYGDLNSTLGNVMNIIKYSFIIVSACIGLVIVLSFIGLKLLSYIPLTLSQIVMLSSSIIIIILYSTNYLTDIIKNYVNSQTFNNSKINIDNIKIDINTGGILIIVSTGLLIITHILYTMLA